MAGKRDIEAGRAFILLGLKNNVTNGLRAVAKQLTTFEGTANKLGESFVRIGTFITAPLLAAGLASEKVRGKLDEARKTLTTALEPVLLPMVDAFTQIVSRVAKWITQNKETVALVIKIGVGMVAVGVALKVAAAAAAILSTALTVAAAITSVIPASILLIGVAIVGLVAAWMTFTKSGQEAARRIHEVFRRVVTDIRNMFSGLPSAILAGQWELIGEIISKTIQIAITGAMARVLVTLQKALGGIPGLGPALNTAGGGITADLIRLTAELAALKGKIKKPGEGLAALGEFPALGGAGKSPVSTFTTGGALALGFGISSIPQRTLEEMKLLRRSMHLAEMHLREMKARRERPGIFAD